MADCGRLRRRDSDSELDGVDNLCTRRRAAARQPGRRPPGVFGSWWCCGLDGGADNLRPQAAASWQCRQLLTTCAGLHFFCLSTSCHHTPFTHPGTHTSGSNFDTGTSGQRVETHGLSPDVPPTSPTVYHTRAATYPAHCPAPFPSSGSPTPPSAPSGGLIPRSPANGRRSLPPLPGPAPTWRGRLRGPTGEDWRLNVNACTCSNIYYEFRQLKYLDLFFDSGRTRRLQAPPGTSPRA